MADASYTRASDLIRLTAGAAVAVEEAWQLPGGLAGAYTSRTAASSGAATEWRSSGQYVMPKVTGFVALAGLPAYWDHSENKANYKKVGDRDFYLGRFASDAAGVDTSCTVNINIPEDVCDIDLFRDAYETVPVGTQALGGFLPPQRNGGSLRFVLDATNEAQKVDALSVDSFSKNANGIVEIIFRVPSDGAGTVVDASIGIASGTHAADAESITNFLLVHLDANSTNISLHSKDGTTTVAITDTTADYVEGSALANRVFVWLDTRVPADCQCYVNGSLVLGATAFDLSAAANEFKLLAHVEKTSAADTYELAVDRLRVYLSEQ